MTRAKESRSAPLRWAVTGSGGQVGSWLVRHLAATPGHALVVGLPHAELDIADPDAVGNLLTELPGGPPDVLANAAAMTHVDLCEAQADAAHRANALAPGWLAESCRRAGTRFVHLSTDYVFDGRAKRAYTEEDAPNPLSVYGRTKLEGERRVFAEAPEALVVRTSWVFGPGRCFVRSILAQARRVREGSADRLRVVADQTGRPTWAGDLAEGMIALVAGGARGLYHLANSGTATWWDLARAALDATGQRDLPVERIRTREMPRPATRPAWSVLDTAKAERAGVRLRPWREALEAHLALDDAGHPASRGPA